MVGMAERQPLQTHGVQRRQFQYNTRAGEEWQPGRYTSVQRIDGGRHCGERDGNRGGQTSVLPLLISKNRKTLALVSPLTCAMEWYTRLHLVGCGGVRVS